MAFAGSMRMSALTYVDAMPNGAAIGTWASAFAWAFLLGMLTDIAPVLTSFVELIFTEIVQFFSENALLALDKDGRCPALARAIWVHFPSLRACAGTRDGGHRGLPAVRRLCVQVHNRIAVSRNLPGWRHRDRTNRTAPR
jgi:hypothetical protein